MRYISNLFLIALSVLLVAGCETNIPEHSDSVPLTAAVQKSPRLIITEGGHMHLRVGYSISKFKAGSIWKNLGTIPQGKVFKGVNTTLMVNTGGDNHEGYLVVDQNRAVGVYLPFESVFVAVRKPATISFTEAMP